MRCERRRSERSRSWSSASRALRSASSRMRRLSPRSACRTSWRAAPLGGAPRTACRSGHRALHHHLRAARRSRSRSTGARTPPPPRPRRARRRSRGRSSGGRRARRRAPGTPGRWRRCPRRPRRSRRACHRLVRDPLALEQRRTAFSRLRNCAACSNSCSSDALLHPLVERLLDLAVAPRQEVDDRLDVLAVLLLGDVADAGRLAALDVVVEAGAARTRGPARRRRRCGTGRPCRAGRASRARAWRWRTGRSRRGPRRWRSRVK